MNIDQQIERSLATEFPKLLKLFVCKTDSGEYEAFGKYRIVPEKPGYRVFCSATDVGVFANTRNAISWCVADKYRCYDLARDLLWLDQKLTAITDDITVRAAVGDRSSNPQFREDITIKLEGKIIMKKQLELQLINCVEKAKYYQQRGFDNETARTIRKPNKASRKGI